MVVENRPEEVEVEEDGMKGGNGGEGPEGGVAPRADNDAK